MLERIYFSLWGVLTIAMGLFYIAGILTMFTVTVFGFIAFGLIFMGMIGVLPFWSSHQPLSK